jgi:hypothetical protein
VIAATKIKLLEG